MRKYRLCFLNEKGQTTTSEFVWCASDAEAIELASQVNIDFAVEIWSGDDVLATVPKARPPE